MFSCACEKRNSLKETHIQDHTHLHPSIIRTHINKKPKKSTQICIQTCINQSVWYKKMKSSSKLKGRDSRAWSDFRQKFIQLSSSCIAEDFISWTLGKLRNWADSVPTSNELFMFDLDVTYAWTTNLLLDVAGYLQFYTDYVTCCACIGNADIALKMFIHVCTNIVHSKRDSNMLFTDANGCSFDFP